MYAFIILAVIVFAYWVWCTLRNPFGYQRAMDGLQKERLHELAERHRENVWIVVGNDTTMGELIKLEKYREQKKNKDAHDRLTKARSLLSNWTYVHETNKDEFTLEMLELAVERQIIKYDGPRCSVSACRLWTHTNGECYLHTVSKGLKEIKSS